MTAVLGGLGAAICFAVATLCSSRTSRMIGPGSVLAWVALVGLAVVGPFVLLGGVPGALDAKAVGWLALSGIGNAAGLLFAYTGLRSGKVGIVAPIVSTEGAVAALIALAAGERITLPIAVTLVLIAAGVLLAALAADAAIGAGGTRRPAVFAAGAAVSFGVSLYATARVGRELPIAWAVLPGRLIGVALVALPLAASSRLRLSRGAAPLVLLAGACEVGGFASFTVGARDAIAVSAVLASLFAAFATIAAYFLFRERLVRDQRIGVAGIVLGVALLSVLRT
ncbi:MAG: EamA family transporter [Thermoleophilaceae bacterium]